MPISKKIIRFFNVSWLRTLFFNFYYLPFSQAVKLPILIYRGEWLSLKGHIKISCNHIYFGMIQLGYRWVPISPKQGIIFSNRGTIIFHGKCNVGNTSSLRVHKNAVLEFGDNFVATHGLVVDCFKKIEFKENCRNAWNVTLMDSSQHRIKNMQNEFVGSDFSPISIGKNNWLASGCLVLKGTCTNDFMIFAAHSILNKDYSKAPTHCLMAGNPVTVKKVGVWRDVFDDGSDYFDTL